MASRRSSDSPRSPTTQRVTPSSETGEATAARKPAKRATKRTSSAATGPKSISPDMRRAMIAEAAYLRAERRGFAPGGEVEDWLAAEREVDALLAADQTLVQ
jgi:hypothetical protein